MSKHYFIKNIHSFIHSFGRKEKVSLPFVSFVKQERVLSHGGLRKVAVNFDTYQILQRHRAVFLLCHCTTFLYTSAAVQMLKLQYVIFHGRDENSQ